MERPEKAAIKWKTAPQPFSGDIAERARFIKVAPYSYSWRHSRLQVTHRFCGGAGKIKTGESAAERQNGIGEGLQESLVKSELSPTRS